MKCESPISEPINVLFTHFGEEWIRGSEMLLLDLLRGLDPAHVCPVLWCNGAEMAQACRDAGYTTYHQEFRHFLDYSSPRLSLSFYRGLVAECRRLCRAHAVRVLHANGGAPVQWLVPAGFGERLPVLAHLHIDYLRRSRYALLLHAATLAVGVSAQVVAGLIEDGMPAAQTEVIYNGIDFSRLRTSDADLKGELGIPAEAPVIATVGSLIPRKGHDVLIRALGALGPRSPAPHLLIASDGPERERLGVLAASLGLSERVHILGHVADLPAVYCAADLFALASRRDAFGLVLAEAGHYGLPVVSTRVGGIPEVIVNEETGLLTPPDDPPAFTAAIARLLDDANLRARMGAAAMARADSMFSSAVMARRFEETYRRLAALPRERLGWTAATRMAGPAARLIRTFGKPAPDRSAPAA
jgi:hypothetical protein